MQLRANLQLGQFLTSLQCRESRKPEGAGGPLNLDFKASFTAQKGELLRRKRIPGSLLREEPVQSLALNGAAEHTMVLSI